MRKLLTMASTLVFAAVLVAPAFAARPKAAKQSTEPATATATQGKAKSKTHAKHSHKKGTTTNKKSGKQGTSPSSGK